MPSLYAISREENAPSYNLLDDLVQTHYDADTAFFCHLNSRRLLSSFPFKTGQFWEDTTFNCTLPTSHHTTPSWLWHGNGLRLGRIIVPPTALISEVISETHLFSKAANRLRPAFVLVRENFFSPPGTAGFSVRELKAFLAEIVLTTPTSEDK
ncbi:hypothetical protein AVEN_257278-1 [Araneus ventricosus]|uniref:Uncharacterized protein n=1 Tax=Araneus ventricosus TaxID=182803 RepID=A0A4Y2HBK9_ARAVE|nr:hypothetical protein AVEN_257278-1 [Araneus ventricosus]